MDEGSQRIDFIHLQSSIEEVRGTNEEWKNIIFIPFDKKWEIMVVIGTLIQTCTAIYDLIFGNLNDLVKKLYIVNEFIYFLDTILIILHRNMKTHRKKRTHMPKNLFLIAIDVFTLLPIINIYEVVQTTSGLSVNAMIKDIGKMQVLPRFYRIILYFSKLRNSIGLNQLFVICLYILIRIIIMTLVISCIFYVIEGGEVDMMRNLKNWNVFIFEVETRFEYFLATVITIGNLLLNNSHGLIGVSEFSETCIILISISVGYLFKIMIVYGELTSVYIKILTRHFNFTSRFHLIESFMDDWEITNKTRKRIVIYLHDSWNRQKGIRDLPSSAKFLPINFYKDLAVDIAWEAFRHSHLLAQEELAFKKSLSMHVKYKFFVPGDILFKTNDKRYKMFYINSGIIQILSDEDDESPIISFSSGTLIGEICLLMFHHNKTVLRCATHCEILTLSMTDFYKTLLMYPNRSRDFRLALNNRIEKAKIGLKIVERHFQMKRHSLEIPETTIKSLKRRWRTISHLFKETKRNTPVQLSEYGIIDGVHTSEYLNMIVLSDNVDLKLKAIFLKKHFPFILDPDSDLANCWQYFMLICIFTMDILLPIYVCYNFNVANMKFIIYGLDFFYFVDAFIQMFMAIKLKQQTISTFKQILLHRCNQGSFIVDVIVALPLDYYLEYFTRTVKIYIYYYKLIRLMKTYRIIGFLRKLKENNWYYPVLLRLITYIFVVCFVVHIIAALRFSIMTNFLDDDSFAYFENDKYREWKEMLLTIYYVASLFMCKQGEGSIEYTLTIYVTSYFISLIGYFFLTYCFCEFCALFVQRLICENEYNGEMNNLRNYLFALNIPKTIFRKLQDVLIFNWKLNKNFAPLGRSSTLNCITKSLRNEMLRNRIVGYLKKVPLFDGLNEEFFQELYIRTTLDTLPANHEIIRHNSDIYSLRIISRGYCLMSSHVPIDDAYERSRILGPCDAFPMLEVVHRVPSFIKVETITACEILRIYIEDIITFMKINKSFYKDYTYVTTEHKLLNQRILSRDYVRVMPEMISTERSLNKGEYFTYTLLDQNEDDLLTRTKIAFEGKINERMGKSLKLIKFLMLKRTIHPQSIPFIWFQVYISLMIFMMILLNLMRFNLYGKFIKDHHVLSKIIDFFMLLTFLINMYVCLHVQYYNKRGLLIYHHRYTASNYLRSNFLPDVIAVIPWRELQITRIFGQNKVEETDLFVTLLFRVLLVYRIFGLLTYFQSESSKNFTMCIKVFKVLFVIALLLISFTNAFLIFTCEYDEEKGYCVCDEESWITSTLPRLNDDEITALDTTLLSFFIVVCAVSGATVGEYELVREREILVFFIIISTGVIIRTYFVANITSAGIGGATTLNRFQQEVKLFLKFVKHETIEEELIQETINFYEYIFKKTKGQDFLSFTRKFYTTLRADFTYSVFESTLKQVQLFRNMDPSFFRYISMKFNLYYYRKDITVICCNDVQENLYFVHKGCVDIVIAKQKICTLRKGGVFGNFHNKFIRQTIFAYTRVNTELIVINCKKFHKVISHYPRLNERINNINLLNCEFWEANSNVDQSKHATNDEHSVVQVNTSSANESGVSWKSSNFIKLFTRSKILHTSSSYDYFHQFFDFHLAALSSMIVLYFIFLSPYWLEIPFVIVKYSIDFLYLTKFYIGFCLTYTDPESGTIIDDKKLIAVRYLKRIFWLDVFTILPMDLIPMLMKANYKYQRVLSTNRAFRFIYVIQYYNKRRFKLKGVSFVRWSFMIYVLSFIIEMLTCIWYVVWCWDEKCVIYDLANGYDWVEVHMSKAPYLANLMALYHVLNVFTQSGLKTVGVRDYVDTYTTIVIIFVTQYLTAILARTVTKYLVVKYSNLNSYEYSLQNLREYLKSRELSPAILNRTWQYMLNLWIYRKGESLPIMICNAPTYLKQNIMHAMYGTHLENHILFSKTHVDFLRQLVCQLKPVIFFPNDCIVEKNDVDSTMYFIHTGEVIVYDVMGNNEMIVQVLGKSMTFGEAQGLHNIPHTFTYKAQTTCDILLLRRHDWTYLIEWFPASIAQIFKGAEENLLNKSHNYRAYDFVYETK